MQCRFCLSSNANMQVGQFAFQLLRLLQSFVHSCMHSGMMMAWRRGWMPHCPLLCLLMVSGALAFVAPMPSSDRLVGTRGGVCRMAEGDGRQEAGGWPALRAMRTFWTFNRPTFGGTATEQKSGVPRAIGSGLPFPQGVVLVTGATGGVGKRVVDVLLKKGVRVRALARNKSKALAILNQGQEPKEGDQLEIVVADVSQPSTLKPEVFKDVVGIVACTAAIVQPKEGDGPDRAKYYQGIKFYEPETVDKPEEVDYNGIVNTLEAAHKFADLKTKRLFSTQPAFLDSWKAWAPLDDIVMGGISESSIELVPGLGEEQTGARIAAVFKGRVSTGTGFSSGGFVSARTRNLVPPLDLEGYTGIKLRVKGDGNRYKFILRDSEVWDGPSWSTTFDTVDGEWIDAHIPFNELIPVMRTRSIPPSQRQPFRAESIHAVQVMLSKFEYDGELNPRFREGPFQLVISSVEAYSEVKTPRIVYVSSAGVTRPGRPGLKLEEEPPAVRMNDMLGGILTYKLKAEDAIRDSGIPYTIIRPCALTEEPAGAPLVVETGDNIKGKISRNDVAQVAVAALKQPGAANLTFEVMSDIPFSQIWEPTGEQLDYEGVFSRVSS